MNGAAAGQMNLLAGQNNSAVQQHIAQMQARLALELQNQQQNNSDRGDDSEDDDDRLSGKSDGTQSRSQSPPDNRSGDEPENGSDRSTPTPPQSWSFGINCNFCNKSFSSQPELLQHIKNHYLEQKDDKTIDAASAGEMTAAR